jgi:type IV pilus assembly protein PilF
MAYLKQGDRLRAKRKLLSALDLSPNSADVNAAIAYYFEKTGEIKQARIFYKKALSLAPNSGSQLNNYGSFLCRLGSYKEAEGYFIRAVSDVRYINTAGAYENAGLCAAAIPDYDKALGFFAKALKQDPKRKQSLYELARIELKQNRAAKALAYIEQYPKLTMHEPALLVLAIDASRKSGNLKAEQAYKIRLSNLNNL